MTGIFFSIASNGAFAREGAQETFRSRAPAESSARCRRRYRRRRSPPCRAPGCPASAPYASDEQLQRLDAAGASPLERRLRDRRRRVAHRRGRSPPRRRVVRDAMDVDEARARTRHARPRRGRIARSDRAAARSRDRCGRQSRHARLPTATGSRRPSTLCSSAMPRPVPAAISAMLPSRIRFALLQRVQLGIPEHGDRMRHRLKVVQKRTRLLMRNAAATRLASTRHGTLVKLRRVVDDRTGDAEARAVDRRAVDRLGLRGTRRSSRSGRGSRAWRKHARARWLRPRPRRIEKPEPRARAADVTGEDHGIG